MQIAQIVYALSFAHRFDFVILLYILRLICSPPLPSSESLCVCECVRRHALALVRSLSRTCSSVCSLLRFFLVIFLNRHFIFSRILHINHETKSNYINNIWLLSCFFHFRFAMESAAKWCV